jgi:hypothetical protein
MLFVRLFLHACDHIVIAADSTVHCRTLQRLELGLGTAPSRLNPWHRIVLCAFRAFRPRASGRHTAQQNVRHEQCRLQVNAADPNNRYNYVGSVHPSDAKIAPVRGRLEKTQPQKVDALQSGPETSVGQVWRDS